MKKKKFQTSSGESAWEAAKADMKRRNEAAREGAAAQGIAQADRNAARRREAARLEAASVPRPRGTEG